MKTSAISAADLTHHLRGIHFPAGKTKLIQQARSNNADEAVIREIQAMPDQEFHGMADVTAAMHEAGEVSSEE